jgi:hypothetical protein
LLVPDWRPTLQQALWAIRIIVALIVILAILTLIGQPYGITLWDWAKLLIVPAVIADDGIWFNQRQQERDRQNAERLAQDNALQAYLDAMSDLITEHRLRTSQPSRDEDRNAAPEPSTEDEDAAAVPSGEDEDVTPSSDKNVRAVAQARTLTVLMTLSSGDGDVEIGAGVRKGSVLQFLYDAGLITGRPPP